MPQMVVAIHMGLTLAPRRMIPQILKEAIMSGLEVEECRALCVLPFCSFYSLLQVDVNSYFLDNDVMTYLQLQVENFY